MHNFGLDITASIAASAECDENGTTPINLGVALMNVPMLRETYDDFLTFILAHTDNPVFKNNNISDQGAFLEYYKSSSQFLPAIFNIKPYWRQKRNFDKRKIVHFHGLKPHDILKVWMGYSRKLFSPALKNLIKDVVDKSNKGNVCDAMYDFSVFIAKDAKALDEYCDITFGSKGEEQNVGICITFFTALAAAKGSRVRFCREQILKSLLTEA